MTLCLGYCNLAAEDFIDENVKYIREGFEKRVSLTSTKALDYMFCSCTKTTRRVRSCAGARPAPSSSAPTWRR